MTQKKIPVNSEIHRYLKIYLVLIRPKCLSHALKQAHFQSGYGIYFSKKKLYGQPEPDESALIIQGGFVVRALSALPLL